MQSAIERLLSISSDPICDPASSGDVLSACGHLGDELATILRAKNGFYAYESALLVRPLHHARPPLGLVEWNRPELWKGDYSEDLSDALCFAEDIFGGQYCIRNNKVWAFDPETGQTDAISASLEDWAGKLLADRDFRTGYPLAHAWQVKNGPLAAGQRLLPKVPFVCGGNYEIENLYAADDAAGMAFCASITDQIRDLPDGAQIRFAIRRDGGSHTA